MCFQVSLYLQHPFLSKIGLNGPFLCHAFYKVQFSSKGLVILFSYKVDILNFIFSHQPQPVNSSTINWSKHKLMELSPCARLLRTVPSVSKIRPTLGQSEPAMMLSCKVIKELLRAKHCLNSSPAHGTPALTFMQLCPGPAQGGRRPEASQRWAQEWTAPGRAHFGHRASAGSSDRVFHPNAVKAEPGCGVGA